MFGKEMPKAMVKQDYWSGNKHFLHRNVASLRPKRFIEVVYRSYWALLLSGISVKITWCSTIRMGKFCLKISGIVLKNVELPKNCSKGKKTEQNCRQGVTSIRIRYWTKNVGNYCCSWLKYVTPLSCMVEGRNTIGNLPMQHVAATNHSMSTGRATSPCKIRCGGTS